MARAEVKQPVYVLGVGLTKFTKPGGPRDYPSLGLEACTKALLDAHLTYDAVDAVAACYCFGDSTCGQRVVYQLGMTQVPVYNVHNNCSTGSTGLALARDLIAGGVRRCMLVVGFERMARGSLGSGWRDRASPLGPSIKVMSETRGVEGGRPLMGEVFGNAGREYMERYGATLEDFAEIARINHLHSKNNPYSQFQDVYTLQDILDSPPIHHPLTKLQCCPTSDGAGAAILVSASFLSTLPAHLGAQAVLIAGQALTTDAPSLFSGSSIDLVGRAATSRAAGLALAEAGATAADVQVVELHDCFSANQMVSLEALGLCEEGGAHEMVRRGDVTYGGRHLVNPSGGLISKGHPLGATGVAQCAELVWHLRGWAGARGREGTRVGMQHNLGLGGACVVTVYRRADGGEANAVGDEEVGRVTGLGYNPAVECREVSEEDVKRVRSREFSEGAMAGEKVKARI